MKTQQEIIDDYNKLLKDLNISDPDYTHDIVFDPALIEVWTVLELLSEPEFIVSWSNDWKLLWSKKVYVTEILWDADDGELLIYRVDWIDENDNLVWVDITDADIKKIVSKIPYENLWKWFYWFKWKTYFNPNFDTSKPFSENSFLSWSEQVKIINDTTIEIKNKKFKKILKKNW